MDRTRTNQIYRLLSSGDECRKRWRNLRECYRKALKARKTKSGQAAMKIKPWRLEKQMSFMQTFLAEREQHSNCPAADLPEGEPINEANCGDSDAPSPSPSTSSAVTKSTPHHNYKTMKYTATSIALQEFVDYKKNRSHVKADHLTKYFQATEETVRTFPILLQIEVKSKISQIIHEAELKNITSQTSSTASVYPQIHTNHTSLSDGTPISIQPSVVASSPTESLIQSQSYKVPLSYTSPPSHSSHANISNTHILGSYRPPLSQIAPPHVSPKTTQQTKYVPHTPDSVNLQKLTHSSAASRTDLKDTHSHSHTISTNNLPELQQYNAQSREHYSFPFPEQYSQYSSPVSQIQDYEEEQVEHQDN